MWHRLKGRFARAPDGIPKFHSGDRQQTPPTPGGGSLWFSPPVLFSGQAVKFQRFSESALGILFQFREDELRHFFQRVENSLAGDGHGFHGRLPLNGQLLLEFFDRKYVWKVALVRLQYIGNGSEVEIM